MNIHTIIILGRATKDGEIIKSKSGKNDFAKFSVAVNEYIASKKEEKSYFYNVLVFGNTASKVVELIKKGDVVMVHGRPEVSAFLPKKSKEPKAEINVISESWKVLK